MTTDIRFTKDSFSFSCNGQRFCVHTEVSEGSQSRVVVEEVKPEPVSEEASE